MDDLAHNVRPSHPAAAAAAVDATATAEGLAKRFFVLTMLGIIVYVSAILMLMSSGSNSP
jgi:hypothetical protein